jgi:hypothetical protein
VSAIRKIISGGQSGVDRAALDFAIEVGLPYGGYVPRGGRAEDFQIPPGLLEYYPELREHESRDWEPRTHLNIQKSSATLVVVDLYHPMGPGTKLTINLAKKLSKPHIVIGLKDDGKELQEFLSQFDEPIALNIAGSRESLIPGVYFSTMKLLRRYLTTHIVQ